MMADLSNSRTLWIPRRGYNLHAEAIAPKCPDSPWVVFGNSLVTDLTIWDDQAAFLAGQYGILRYDQAGHGRSGLPPSQVDFDELGADLLAVMDAAGVDRAIYIGLSMGVPTGLAAHRQAASRFATLIFSDGQARTMPVGAATWADRIAAARASGMAAYAAATADRWLTKASSPDTRARLIGMIAATPFDGFRIGATALMDYDYTAELSRIGCPTLLIAGAEDGAMPDSMADVLHPAIAGSVMQVIPGAGHIPCFEQPEAFTATIAGFLDSVAMHNV